MVWIAWSVTLAAHSIFLHYVYRSTSLDLALHSQLLWNLARGRFMETSFLPYSFAGNHFWPGLYLLVPFHEIFGTVGLLAVQPFVTAAGLFPVYCLTFDLTKRSDWATVLGICYLLHPTVSIGVLFDFHPEFLAMPCMLAALCLLYRRMYVQAGLITIISWSLYEVTAAMCVFFGILLYCRSGSRKLGLTLVLSSLSYLLVVVFLVMPHFRHGPWLPHMERWMAPEVTSRDIRQIGYLLVAVGLTPLLGIRYLVPAIPLLTVLACSNLGLQMDIRFGYVTPVIPFFFLAAAHGVKRLDGYNSRRLRAIQSFGPSLVLLLAVVLSSYFHLKRPIRSHPFRLRGNLDSIRAATALVPSGASLSTDNHLGAHFAKRRSLLLTPQTQHNSAFVAYVLADLHEDKFKSPGWLSGIRSSITTGGYVPVFFSDGVVLLKKAGGPSPLTSEVLEYMDRKERGLDGDVQKRGRAE